MALKPKDDVKEPKLSTHIKDVLKRSLGSELNVHEDEIYRTKHKIMQLLTSNQDLLSCIRATDIGASDLDNGDLYRDKYIFDYLRLPDLKSEVKNYVCFEVNDSISSYDSRVTRTITFRVVSYKGETPTDWGISRQDLMALIVKDIFDWNCDFGLTLVKTRDYGQVTADDYYYREIVYTTTPPSNLHKKMNGR